MLELLVIWLDPHLVKPIRRIDLRPAPFGGTSWTKPCLRDLRLRRQKHHLKPQRRQEREAGPEGESFAALRLCVFFFSERGSKTSDAVLYTVVFKCIFVQSLASKTWAD